MAICVYTEIECTLSKQQQLGTYSTVLIHSPGSHCMRASTSANFVSWRTSDVRRGFSFSFLNLQTLLKNSVWQIERGVIKSSILCSYYNDVFRFKSYQLQINIRPQQWCSQGFFPRGTHNFVNPSVLPHRVKIPAWLPSLFFWVSWGYTRRDGMANGSKPWYSSFNLQLQAEVSLLLGCWCFMPCKQTNYVTDKPRKRLRKKAMQEGPLGP